MSDIAIKIENLSKRYRYGAVASVNDTLRADLTEWARGLFARRNQPGGTRSLASAADSSLPRSERNQPGGTRSLASATSSTADPSTLNSQHSTFREVHEKHIAEDPNYFWALKGINIEVRRGETCPPKLFTERRRIVGIIGRNGAGKSLGQSS